MFPPKAVSPNPHCITVLPTPGRGLGEAAMSVAREHQLFSLIPVRSTAVMIDQDDAQGDRATAATDGGPGEDALKGSRKDIA